MPADEPCTAFAGRFVRRWRERCGASRPDLALRAGLSVTDLHALETGSRRPHREVLLRVAEVLELPLRARNELLHAAGHRPAFPENPLAIGTMRAVRTALRGLGICPALAVDRRWDVVAGNAAAALFTDRVAAELLVPPANLLRMCLDPRGIVRWVVNPAQWTEQLLGLYRELTGCRPGPRPARADPFVALRIRLDGQELVFAHLVANFVLPRDVTVSELTVQSFVPVDAVTARWLGERETSFARQHRVTPAE